MHVIKHLSKATECTILRLDSDVNYDLGVIMVCQCRVLYCNECTTKADVDNGRGSAWGGGGVIWEVSFPSS